MLKGAQDESSKEVSKPKYDQNILKKYADTVIKSISKLKKDVFLTLGICPEQKVFSA